MKRKALAMSDAHLEVHERIMDEARCHRWRAMLIGQQIEELRDVTRPDMLRALDLLFEAEKWCCRDELDAAEGLLRRAELEVIAVKRHTPRAAA